MSDQRELFHPTTWQRIIGVVWDGARKDPVERRLLLRLDVGILIYQILSFIIQCIDTNNVTNAYVSGMKEDLQLYGNELNYFSTAIYVGYVIGCIPAQFILYKMRPSTFIPICNIIWGVLVMCLGAVSHAWHIYIIRFLIGLCEAVCYPAFTMIVSSWYKPDELAKRMVIYDASTAIGAMCAGYIQAGVYHSMNGRYGLAGWKWQFIVDGLISLPVGMLGFYCIPDFPKNTRVRWLNDKQRELCIQRMDEVGRKGQKKMTRKRFWKIFTTFNVYPFLITYSIYITNGFNYMNLWLESLGTYSIEMINILPTIGYAIAFVGTFIYAMVSDTTGWRWQSLMVAIAFNFLGNLLLALWDIPFGLKFFAYLCPNFGQPIWGLLVTWSSELFPDDAELRGLLPAIGNTIWYGLNSFVPILAFPMQDAPHFPVGYWISSAFLLTMAIGVVTMLIGNYVELRKKAVFVNKYGVTIATEDADDSASVSSSAFQQPGMQYELTHLKKTQSRNNTD
ncbi:major facilitator superfamily domain-containing protein [Lipomyces japonicus]|uniref:major facilitator superfamily domain-containing protein n=1 Tax=Lipomyces japonicus TaxID=56871 RepID=UPI0034CEABFF